MEALALRLLTILVDGLVVAVPLLLVLLRIYVQERKRRAEAEAQADLASTESALWKEEHKSVLRQPAVDEDQAAVQQFHTEAIVKERAKIVVARKSSMEDGYVSQGESI